MKSLTECLNHSQESRGRSSSPPPQPAPALGPCGVFGFELNLGVSAFFRFFGFGGLGFIRLAGCFPKVEALDHAQERWGLRRVLASGLSSIRAQP